MRCKLWIVIAAVCAIIAGRAMADNSPHARLDQLALSQVEIRGGFWGERHEQLWKTVLPYQWTQLEQNHDVDNFRVLAGVKQGIHQGPVYIDSDLYKWLEAASYVSGAHPDDLWLSARVDELAGLIAKTQMPDGYLNTYYQTFAPERRWTNLVMNHELYCAGHFIEAAVANKESTGKDELLNVAKKLADHIGSTFGPGRNQGVPGHEELELALIRLYRQTGDKKFLESASWFISQRGRYTRYPQAMIKSLADQSSLARIVNDKRRPWLKNAPKAKSATGYIIGSTIFDPRIPAQFLSGKYFQDDRTYLETTVGEGHAVRAMYFFTGAADLYLERGDPRLLETAERIWENTTGKRMYVTGGLGALPGIEGFGRDYELPNKSYTETCAAIGSFFWNWRLLRASANPRYAQLMERTLYNAILPAISLKGTEYFYQNPLASSGRDQRSGWYGCACCPPNLARLFASLGRYLYSSSPDAFWVHQYISGSAEFEAAGKKIRLNLESALPWSGQVKIKLRADQPASFALMLRVPEWAENAGFKVNGQPVAEKAEAGRYLRLNRLWKDSDEIVIDFPMEVRMLKSAPQVRENRGRVAVMRGPVIYCLEDKDNPGVSESRAQIDKSSRLTPEFQGELLGGVVTLKAKAVSGGELTLIPYFAWANRGPSDMRVWIRAK